MRDSPPGGGWSDGTGLGKDEIKDQSKSPKFLIFKDLHGLAGHKTVAICGRLPGAGGPEGRAGEAVETAGGLSLAPFAQCDQK